MREAEGLSVLLVDQSTTLALAVTDTAYLLDVGRIQSSGPTAALLADGSVRAAYLGADVESTHVHSGGVNA